MIWSFVAAQGATLDGSVHFVADYDEVAGQVPVGNSALPHLYIEAYRLHGSVDAAEVPGDPSDVLVGAARAEVDGTFSIDVGSAEQVYLLTWLCDDDDVNDRSSADICVRRNDPAGNGAVPQNRKYIWSEPFSTTTTAAWNLSCPADPMTSNASCSTTLEPQGGFLCVAGATNSNVGCNKEAVHIYRAAIEAYKTWGSNQPKASNTIDQYCNTATCQDEINFFLAPMTLDLFDEEWGGDETCLQASSNVSRAYDQNCITTPFSPFRVVHELGHTVHRRWMKRSAAVASPNTGGGAPDQCATETRQVAEGWADFVATSAWFNGASTAPVYLKDGTSFHDMEDPSTFDNSGCHPSVPWRQGLAGQWFWDLRDTPNAPGEDDTVDTSFQKIRNVWSAFPSGSAEGEKNEASTPRNAIDFYHHYRCRHPADGLGVWALLVDHDLHLQGGPWIRPCP